jgi:predicted permease
MTGPALRWSATAPSRSLRDGGPGRSAAAGGRARSVLVAVQLALALTLVVGSGLLARSLASLLREDPGFDVVDALTLRVSFRGASYGDSASIVDAQRRLLDRVSALPGVAAAGITDALPLGLETNQSPVTFPGAPHVPDEGEGISDLADVFSITPGYAEAVGLRILGGRALRPSDETAPLGALIDDVVAARWFPQGGAVGATMLYGGGTLTVVGVVDQARFYDVFRDDRGQVYLPRAYAVQREAWLAVRVATGNPLDLLPAVRAALGEIDPTLPVAEVRTLEAIVRAALGGERLNLTLVGAFALAALVLAGLGLYGVVNGSVLQRRREIGIRMAVGAEPARVVRMIVGQGARLVGAGTLVGLAGAWVAGRLLASLLHGVALFDPATYVGAAALLGLLALLATWVPARRATRIRPLETLGSE